MRIPRLYLPEPITAQSEIELPDAAANYIGKVLRLKPGHPLRLFDGRGGEYAAEVIECGKRSVRVAVSTHQQGEVESPLALTLVQAVSKGERMDLTLQKAVELGVTRIAPVFSERSVVNLKGDRLDKRLEHWQGVIISACEQCGRNTLPHFEAAVDLDHWLATPLPADALGLLLQPESPQGLRELQPPEGETLLLVGPEGGFSDQEIDSARKAGYRGIRLGPRVLRTETAGLAALASLQTLWGDLG